MDQIDFNLLEQEIKKSRCFCSEIYPANDTQLKQSYMFDKNATVNHIIEIISSTILKWEYLSTPILEFRNTIEENGDENTFYLKLIVMNSYIPALDKFMLGLRLFSISVPKNITRRGLATSIISTLESFAADKKLPFIIGPVIAHNMHMLIEKKKGYEKRNMFDYMKSNLDLFFPQQIPKE